MAKMDIDFPDDFLGGLLTANTEEMCQKMLKEAAPDVVNNMKKNVRAAVQHEGDSELVNSIKAGKPKKTKNDAYIIHIGPTGNSRKHYYVSGKRSRKYPVSNILKAIWLNYGRDGQAPRPFLTKTRNESEKAAIEKMQEVYNNVVGKDTRA